MRCTTSFCGTSFRNFDKTLKRPVLLGGVFICGKSGSLPLGVSTGGCDPFSFGRRDGLTRGHARETIHLAAGPANLDAVGLFARRETEGQNKFARGKVAGAATEQLSLGFSAGSNTHGGSQAIAIGFRANQLDAQALIRRGRALCIIPE